MVAIVLHLHKSQYWPRGAQKHFDTTEKKEGVMDGWIDGRMDGWMDRPFYRGAS